MNRATGRATPTAVEQLQKTHPRHEAKVQPLPGGSPGRASASDLGITEDPGDGISFYVIGDHGGVKAAGPQNAVSYAIQNEIAEKDAFVYSVGDIVYFYGERWDGFMENFCDAKPSIPPTDPELEFGRHTQTQPYCDWTLDLKAVRIVGLYSNVVPGGHFEDSQTEWLTAELAAAPAGKPLIVGLHHPPYSVDAMHGGSAHVGEVLDKAFDDSTRTPELVLSGHVHDYQRFSRRRGDHTISYVVIGNSGYHNLHVFAKDAKHGEEIADGVTFEYGDAKDYGFLKLTVTGGEMVGSYTGVRPGAMPDGSDAAVSPAKDSFSTPIIAS